MRVWPLPGALAEWIAPAYWEAYRAGTLRESWVSSRPFQHVVLPGFFRPEVFDLVLDACTAVETEQFREGSKTLDQGFLQQPELLRFIFGPSFRGFLETLAASPVVRPAERDVAATAFPQVRHYVRGSLGLRPHTDEDEGFDIGMVLYLSPGWQPAFGGEVSLYRKVGRLLVEDKAIPPLQNSLMLLFFSEHSHHRVNEVSEAWGRSTLSMGWQTARHAQQIKSAEFQVGASDPAASAA